MAAALAVCLFSLAGLPPVAGLWGKLLLFGSALNVDAARGGPVRSWFIALAVIGVLNAAVAAYYYLRIVSLMYFREPLAAPRAEGGPGPYLAALLCSLAVLVLGVYPGPLIRGCAEAGRSGEQGARSGEQGLGNAGWHAFTPSDSMSSQVLYAKSLVSAGPCGRAGPSPHQKIYYPMPNRRHLIPWHSSRANTPGLIPTGFLEKTALLLLTSGADSLQ